MNRAHIPTRNAIFDDRPDCIEALRDYQPLPLGERLVLFFRLNGEALTFWFAMVAVGLLLAVVVGAYVARLS